MQIGAVMKNSEYPCNVKEEIQKLGVGFSEIWEKFDGEVIGPVSACVDKYGQYY